VDRAWLTNPERTGKALGVNDFSGYPLMRTYFGGIRFIGGAPHGLCWIDVQGDGGAYDPSDTIETLKQALDKKLSDYSTPEKQAHLQAHGLSELDLLVHGGFNAYAYNSPSGPLSLEDIAQRGAAFYASHPQRQIFNRLWFYDSLDSADDLNRLIGYPPGYGRVRWLAQRANRRKQEILLSLLREAREQKGLRQSDVAAALNCPQTRVSKYELGTRRLDLLELRDVCKVLGVSLVDFVRTFDAGVGAVESGELKPKVSAPSRRKPEALR
jgi:predicted XRE-type DNA-binding protein